MYWSQARGVVTKSSKTEALAKLLLQMPTDRSPLLKVLKASRKLNMTNSGKYPAGIINLHVLGNGANHGPKSLYLFTDQARYLFNCGEGTQRLAHEHKMKLAKLEHVFLTNNSWDMIGGLPGVALTIQDIGIPTITLHGPPGLGGLFQGTRRFVILKDLNIKVVNAAHLPDESKTTGHHQGHFEDHVLRVDYIPLFKDQEEDLPSTLVPPPPPPTLTKPDEVDYYANYRGLKNTNMVTVIEEDPLDASDHDHPPSALCYLIEPKKKDGSLLIDKCIERGVPPGPLLGQLKAGLDVTLPNGNVVLAKDVRSPDCPGPSFLVVDCPCPSYLPSLLNNPKLKSTQSTDLYVVVHFTNSKVMNDPKYLEWMSNFRISTQHLVMNSLCNGIQSAAIHRLQTKLSTIDLNIFPPLQEEILFNPPPPTQQHSFINIPGVTLAQTLLTFQLRPFTALDNSSVIQLNKAEYLKETADNEDFNKELTKFNANTPIHDSDTPSSYYPRLTFLGTGSSIPNKTRNVSGILLQVTKDKAIIMDCGEGTTAQLARFYGKQLNQVLRTIQVIYISHLHADHHMGLISLLNAIHSAHSTNTDSTTPTDTTTTTPYLIAPLEIASWLNEYSLKFEPIQSHYSLIPITDFKTEFQEKKSSPTHLTNLLSTINCQEIRTDYVKHCPNAFGVSFNFNFNWKVTYSGDTMPCDNLIKIGMNSDLLIHEATMEDELQNEAIIKMHSTISQAIDAGIAMKAKFTILTHFSQRYAKVPIIAHCSSVTGGDGGGDVENVGIAFDNMSVGLSDLPKLGKMYTLLKTLFAEDCEEMQARSAKRRKKKIMSSS